MSFDVEYQGRQPAQRMETGEGVGQNTLSRGKGKVRCEVKARFLGYSLKGVDVGGKGDWCVIIEVLYLLTNRTRCLRKQRGCNLEPGERQRGSRYGCQHKCFLKAGCGSP